MMDLRPACQGYVVHETDTYRLKTTGDLRHGDISPGGLACGVGDGAALQASAQAQGTRDTTTYRRIKAQLDAIPAIDTHDHLRRSIGCSAWSKTDAARG